MKIVFYVLNLNQTIFIREIHHILEVSFDDDKDKIKILIVVNS